MMLSPISVASPRVPEDRSARGPVRPGPVCQRIGVVEDRLARGPLRLRTRPPEDCFLKTCCAPLSP
eukprot:3812620-Alexandrium_andersonii.AAC.1